MIQEQIKIDTIVSMKAKTADVTSILRVISGEFARFKRNGIYVKEVTDDEAIKIIRKLNENAIEQGNVLEQQILEMYLPKMLNEDQIQVIVQNIITSEKYNGMVDLGKTMSEIKGHPDNRLIDGKIAHKIAKELLS